jgi:large subunit ribosomal protein L29
MKASELRQKSKDDLGSLLLELSRERFNLRMQKSTGQLAKPAEIRRVRRDIARILTVMNEKTGG